MTSKNKFVHSDAEAPDETEQNNYCFFSTVQHLREVGVVGKLVEFFGPGVASLSIADRATISNMCPEYGATLAFFPVDSNTIQYLTLTG